MFIRLLAPHYQFAKILTANESGMEHLIKYEIKLSLSLSLLHSSSPSPSLSLSLSLNVIVTITVSVTVTFSSHCRCLVLWLCPCLWIYAPASVPVCVLFCAPVPFHVTLLHQSLSLSTVNHCLSLPPLLLQAQLIGVEGLRLQPIFWEVLF